MHLLDALEQGLQYIQSIHFSNTLMITFGSNSWLLPYYNSVLFGNYYVDERAQCIVFYLTYGSDTVLVNALMGGISVKGQIT